MFLLIAVIALALGAVFVWPGSLFAAQAEGPKGPKDGATQADSSGVQPDSLELKSLELWTTGTSGGHYNGAALTADVTPEIRLHLDYDSSLGNTNDPGEWNKRFKKENLFPLSRPAVAALPSGPWSGWISHPAGTLSLGSKYADLSTAIFQYNRPVDGWHLSSNVGNMALNAFSGTVKQESRFETISIRDDRTVYYLSSGRIVPGSEIVQVQVYASETDPSIIDVFYPAFTLDYWSGKLGLSENPLLRIGEHPASLIVSYDFHSETGEGYSVQGGMLEVSRNQLRGRIGYLNDSYPRGPMRILSLAAGWGGPDNYLNVETTFPLSELAMGPESTAWAAEVGLSSDHIRLGVQGFQNGIAFPIISGGTHNPGESGLAIDVLGNWGRDEIAAGYSIEKDASYSDYAGILLSKNGRVSINHKLTKPLSIGAGYSFSDKWAPGDPAFLGEKTSDSWITLNHNVYPWSWTLIYGWGKKLNSRAAGLQFSALQTRLYGVDLARTWGDSRVYAGVRREDNRLPADDELISRKDSILFGAEHGNKTLTLNLTGTVYELEGIQWSTPRIGTSAWVSLNYRPSNRLSFTSDLNLHWFGDWYWEGATQFAVAVTPELHTTIDLERNSTLERSRVGAQWVPANEGPSGEAYFSGVSLGAGYETSLGEANRFYEAEADIVLPNVGVASGSFLRRTGPNLAAVNTFRFGLSRDLSDRYRLSGYYERRLGRDAYGSSVSQMIAGVKGRYALSPEMGLALGYSWGYGFSEDAPDRPKGLWLGLDSNF